MKNIEEQLIEIETKIAFQDDSIEKLNAVIIQQQNQIKKLEYKLSQLNIKVNEELQRPEENPNQYEIPPHY
jgi:SlyX protein